MSLWVVKFYFLNFNSSILIPHSTYLCYHCYDTDQSRCLTTWNQWELICHFISYCIVQVVSRTFASCWCCYRPMMMLFGHTLAKVMNNNGCIRVCLMMCVYTRVAFCLTICMICATMSLETWTPICVTKQGLTVSYFASEVVVKVARELKLKEAKFR